MLPKLGLLVAGIAASVALASPANATPAQDYIFYSTLQRNGVNVINPQVARTQAHVVCAQLRYTSWRMVITNLMTSINYTLEESAALMGAAVAAYCPENNPMTQDQQQQQQVV